MFRACIRRLQQGQQPTDKGKRQAANLKSIGMSLEEATARAARANAPYKTTIKKKKPPVMAQGPSGGDAAAAAPRRTFTVSSSMSEHMRGAPGAAAAGSSPRDPLKAAEAAARAARISGAGSAGLSDSSRDSGATVTMTPYESKKKQTPVYVGFTMAGDSNATSQTVRDQVGPGAQKRGSETTLPGNYNTLSTADDEAGSKTLSVQSMNRSHQIMQAGTYESELLASAKGAQSKRQGMYNLHFPVAFGGFAIIYCIWRIFLKPAMMKTRQRNEQLQEKHEKIFKPSMERYIAEVKRRKLEDEARVAAGMAPLYPDMKPRCLDENLTDKGKEAVRRMVDINQETENRHGWISGLSSSYKTQKYLSPID